MTVTCTRRGPACTMTDEGCRYNRRRAVEIDAMCAKDTDRLTAWAKLGSRLMSMPSLSLIECLDCKERGS